MKLKSHIGKIKEKALNRETISYLIFGVLTTAINFAVYVFCTKALAIDYRPSNVAAWTAGVVFAYVTNKIFVFQSKDTRAPAVVKEFLSFVLSRLFSGAVDYFGLMLMVEVLRLDDLVSKVIVNVVVIVMNYILSKLIVFNKKN